MNQEFRIDNTKIDERELRSKNQDCSVENPKVVNGTSTG